MSQALNRRELLRRVVEGREVDRLPFSLWRHFYVEETAAEPLAARLAEWHRRFDFDFVKINVRAQYHSEPWGCRYQYSGQEHVKPETLEVAVKSPGDFAQLDVLDPGAGSLGEMLELIRLLRGHLGRGDVLLMTLFNPMAVAGDLCGGFDRLADAMRDDPQSVHQGLRALTDTFRDFAAGCLDAGADGLFFATTGAGTAQTFTIEQIEEFGRPYDIEILEAVDGAFLNMLHVCKPEAFIAEMADYPVHAINWDTNDESNPSLADLRVMAADKALVGGLSRELFSVEGAGEALVRQLDAAREMMDGRPFIVGSTCTVGTDALDENIDVVCRALRSGGA